MDTTPVTGGVDPRETNTPQPRFNTTISKEEFDRKFYKVKTGKALVLNNNKFEVPGVPLADRRGSDADASAISQRFADIGFDYEIDGDMTAKATFEWFENAKTQMIDNPVDCFVLVLLSHGTEDGIYAKDSLMLIEEIIEKFNATNCPQLQFKPKVLIIQSCRGVDVIDDPNQADCQHDDSEYNEWLGIQKIRLPNEADFLFACATVPGTGAFRDTDIGTPFIRLLSNAMQNMEGNEDFYSVLKTVGLTYQPWNNSSELNNVVQMPCFVSHLTKVLRLKQAA